MRPDWIPAVATVLALHVAVTAVVLIHPDLAYLAFEESPQVALARMTAWIGPADLIGYTETPHCGGCWVDAYVGAPWVRLLPDVVLTWRIVPFLWTTLGLLASVTAAWRLGGRTALGWTTAVWLAGGYTWSLYGVHAFGNHTEAAMLTVTCAAVAMGGDGRARTAIAGALGGFSAFVALSSVGAVAGILGAHLARCSWRTRGAGVAGVAVGASPFLLRWLQPDDPFASSLVWGEAEQSRVTKALELLDPHVLAQVFVRPSTGEPWPVAAAGPAAAVAVIVLATLVVRAGPNARIPAVGILGWLAAYLASSGDLRIAPGAPLGARYAMPLLALVPLLAGTALARAAGRRRTLAAIATGVLLTSTLFGKLRSMRGPRGLDHLIVARALHPPVVRISQLASGAVDPDDWHCGSDRTCLGLRAWAAGTAGHRAPGDPEWLVPWAAGRAAGLAQAAAPEGQRAPDRVRTILAALRPELGPGPVPTAVIGEAAWAILYDPGLPPMTWAELEGPEGPVLAAGAGLGGRLGGAGLLAEPVGPDTPRDLAAAWWEGRGLADGLQLGAPQPGLPDDDGYRRAYERGLRAARTLPWVP